MMNDMDVIMTNGDGDTLLMTAVKNGNFSLVQFVTEACPGLLQLKDKKGWNALLHCCSRGSIEVFKYLVQNGMDPTSKTNEGETCLMIAVINNNFSLARHIVKTYPAQLDNKDQDGLNALLYCCGSGSIVIFQYLIQNGMDTTSTTNEGLTCLMIAVLSNNFSMVRHLVKTYPGQLGVKDQNGWNALLYCCKRGSIEMFEYLVQKEMDPTSKTNEGNTCLMIAACNNNLSVVRHIVETYPGQLDVKDQNGLNALLYCCNQGSIEVFKYLVLNGMDTASTTNKGLTCLMIAVNNNNFSMVRHIVETYPGQLDDRDQNSLNALLYCCSSGSIVIFQYLVQNGINTASTSNKGSTGLMIAVCYNNFSMVRHLVETYPGQLDVKDQNGRNALLYCCAQGSIEVFEYLVQHGMDTTSKTNEGLTCLMIAAFNNNFRVVRHIVETYPGQLDVKDQNGWNALLYCCVRGSIEMFQYLVQNGMDTASTTTEGLTCLMIAVCNNNFSVVRHIVETYPRQLDVKTQNGLNALLYCCARGSIEVFQYLIQNGMDTTSTTNEGETCLMIAANNNNFSVVRHIVETYPGQLDVKDQNGWNALLCCCARGSIEMFQYLVQNGMDTVSTTNKGVTCLMIAAKNNNFSVVGNIVETYPGQLDEKDQKGWNTLLYCCAGGSFKMFQYLVQNGMDATSTTNKGVTCLMIAVNNNNFSMVRHIVKTYPEMLSLRDRYGFDALLCCSQNGAIEIFKFLVGKGMVITTTKHGITCLLLAVLNKNLDLIKYIAKNYDDQLLQFSPTQFRYCCENMCINRFQTVVNESMLEKDFYNYTKIIFSNNDDLSLYVIKQYTTQLRAMKRMNLLPIVCVRGNLEVFDALISIGFDPNQLQTKGRTCLMYAAGGGHHDLVQRILSFTSVNIHATDDDGCTALHKCKSLDKSWEYLVKAGLSQKIRNKKGKTPIQEVSRRSECLRKGNTKALFAEGLVDVAEGFLKAYGEDAIQKYLSLFNGVTEKYRHIRVVFLGPEGAGKTTLCQRLQRAPVNLSQRCPTNGGNIYQQLFRVEMDKKSWQRMGTEHAITKRLADLLKGKQSSSKKEIIEEDVDDTVWVPPVKSNTSRKIECATLQEERMETLEEKTFVSISKSKISDTTGNPIGKSTVKVKKNTSGEDPSTSTEGHTTPQYVEVQPHRTFLDATISKFVADTSPESFAFLSLWDMGGHCALQPSVHVFISGHGVYIITINLMECLQDPQEFEKIRNWIRIVGTASYHNTTHKRRQNHPPIIIVGTHMDLVRQEYKDQKERDQRIAKLEKDVCSLPEISKDKTHSKYSFLRFLKVDNSIEDDPAIKEMRDIILDAAELQDQWMREIPANWISLEREILDVRPSHPVLTLEQVAELDADCEKPIEDKAAISLFLEFLDCNRSVIYANELESVITNPQWLLDAFSVVITDVQFMPNETSILLKNDLQLYQEKGLLTHSLVQELFEKSDDKSYRVHLEIILKNLVRFGMIVKNVISAHKFGQPCDNDVYVVPSKLETLDNSKEIEYVVHSKAKTITRTLCFHFKGDLMPLETFEKIYAGILQEYDPLRFTSKRCPQNLCERITYILLGVLRDSEERDIRSIYRDFGCFAVDDSTNMIVSFHWNQSCIAITLYSHIDTAIPKTRAQLIRQKIEDIIKKTLDVCKQDNIAYEYKLHCMYRLDSGDKPRDRIAILETGDGVQCLGTNCGRKHKLCRADWLYWLPDSDDSPPQQDSKAQRDIKAAHAKMINNLSLYITPTLPQGWETFQTSMEAYLGRAEIFGTDVKGLAHICRTLIDKKIIDHGEYSALRSAVEGIHVKAAKIIDDATSNIDKIKHKGEWTVYPPHLDHL